MFLICAKIAVLLFILSLFGVMSIWPAIITLLFVPGLWVLFILIPFIGYLIWNWNSL
jgi:hypothetical protein